MTTVLWDRSEGRTRGGKWMRLRAKIMKRDGFMCQCKKCKGVKLLADEVDHVVPLFKGGTDDPDNLMAMAKACHEAKTRDDLGIVKKVTIGADGWPIDG